MVIETERLFLRKFELTDAPHFFKLNSNPKVLQFTGDKPFKSLEEAKEFIFNYSAYSVFGYGRWAVILKSSNTFIGWCGLKFHPLENYTDLGFRFFEDYWNQGYATESSRGVIEYATTILRLSKLVARVEIENKPCIKVLDKLGFELRQKINFNHTKGFLYQLIMNNV